MPDAWALDSLGIREATLGLPEQFEHAVAAASGVTDLPSADQLDHVVMMGMGGSGIAGDVVRAVAGPMMPIPVVVTKGYACPGFVNDRSLVIAVSFSGNTEETLEAVGIAEQSGAHVLTVTAGGRLGELSHEWGSTVYELDGSIPMPRVAVGAVCVPPLMALERIGLFPGATRWIELTIDQLRRRRELSTAGSDPTLALAERLAGTVPLIYGGGDLGGVAARRWKNQINENVKAPAFSNEMPELCHNEIAGWEQLGDITRSSLSLVHLRHGHEHPQISRRFEFNDEVMADAVSTSEELHAEGIGQLAQLFDLMFVGDLVSLHLAELAGQDPGPIDVLDRLKNRLSPNPDA